jgi:hypothetical protein
MPAAPLPILAVTRRERNRAAFLVQTLWRRRQQLRRLGVFIDGEFFTHAEVAAREVEAERANAAAVELARKKVSSVKLIWRVWLGHLGRVAAVAHRMAIRANPKMKAAHARRKVKRGGLYSADVVLPPHAELKYRLLLRLHPPPPRPGALHRRGSSLTANASGRAPELTRDEWAVVNRKVKSIAK